MKLIFATNNNHKLNEINQLLGGKITLVRLKDIGFNDDIPEDFDTLEENAIFKARYIFNKTGMNLFADDTGLETEVLDGKPGVHSARFAGEGRDFSANIDKLLGLLEGKKNRNARFRTIIALILNGKEYLFEGIAEGVITEERRGTNGFGYDPVFLPAGMRKTFAEIPLDEKNLISHRAKAFEKLRKFLSEYSAANNNLHNGKF
jgi:XTP/dITP diphosphohydrolase